MFDDTLKQLEEMSKLASDSAKGLEVQIDVLGKSMDALLKKAPEENKSEIENAQSLMTRVINMAKNGKHGEVENELNKFRNGRKSSK